MSVATRQNNFPPDTVGTLLLHIIGLCNLFSYYCAGELRRGCYRDGLLNRKVHGRVTAVGREPAAETGLEDAVELSSSSVVAGGLGRLVEETVLGTAASLAFGAVHLAAGFLLLVEALALCLLEGIPLQVRTLVVAADTRLADFHGTSVPEVNVNSVVRGR